MSAFDWRIKCLILYVVLHVDYYLGQKNKLYQEKHAAQ